MITDKRFFEVIKSITKFKNDELKIAAVVKIAIHESLELSDDKKRLDWLADPEQFNGNIQLPTKCVEQNLHSLRAAIDAAMSL